MQDRSWSRRAAFLGLALAVAVVAACGDPSTAPPDRTKANPPRGTPTVNTEELMVPLGSWPASTPQGWCSYALQFEPDQWSSQRQSLDWQDLAGRWTTHVAWARFRMRFRGKIMTYNSQPLQCVQVYNLYTDRTIMLPVNTAQPRTEHNVYPNTNGFAYCYGTTQCAEAPPRIHAQSFVRWYYPVGLGGPNSAVFSIELGGTNFYMGGANQNHSWDVEMHPSGWWTVFDYGGGYDSDAGFWNYGETGYWLAGRYAYSTDPNYYPFREGNAVWHLYAD